MRTTVTNQNLIHEEIKRSWNSGNGCYHSVQNLLSSRLLSAICCLLSATVGLYKTIVLPVVLYGCETWSLILREEHKLRVFENRVLRRIFGLKRDGVTGGWRKLHNEELQDLYSPPSIIRIIMLRRLSWVGHVAQMGKKKNAYKLLVGKGGWRKLHNEDLHDLYSPPSIIRIIMLRRLRWVGHVARMGKKKNAYKLLVGKPERKRSLGRPRCR
jgi:hypothetical protein